MGLLGGSDSDITVKISADTKDATTKIGSLNTTFKTMTASFVAGNLITGALSKGFGFLEGVLSDSVKAWEESEKVVAQMNATLESTHHVAGQSAQQLVDLSQSLEHMTTFSDEAVLSVENLLLTFTNITGETFPAATKAVLDMSVALGEDTSSAAIQLGKALNDPIQGVNALARVGVNFSAAQKEVIATMVKTGDTMGAQQLILAELSKEFGGSAVAQAKTFDGQMKQLANTIDDLEEGIGHGMTAALNNVFIAFNQATSGMGKTADMGKITFQVFSKITEFAVNTVTGIDTLASAFVDLGSYVVQAGSIIGIFSKDARQSFTDFRASVQENNAAVGNFAMNLHDENQKTLAEWDNLTTDAKKYGTTGPSAYQQTAQAAAEAAQKVKDANKAIADTVEKIKDLNDAHVKSTGDNARSAAEAYVAEQQKIIDLRNQISDPDTADVDKGPLKLQLKAEQAALDKYKDYSVANATQINEAKRRAGETQFERDMEDIKTKQDEEDKAFAKTMARDQEELASNNAKRDALIGNTLVTTAIVTAAAEHQTSVIVAESAKQVAAMNKVSSATRSAFGSSSAPFSTVSSTFAPSANSTPATMNFNFPGTVVGDDGIKKLFTTLVGGLDRLSALKSFAGL